MYGCNGGDAMRKRHPDKNWKENPKIYCTITHDKKLLLEAMLKARKQTIAQFLREWVDANIEDFKEGIV